MRMWGAASALVLLAAACTRTKDLGSYPGGRKTDAGSLVATGAGLDAATEGGIASVDGPPDDEVDGPAPADAALAADTTPIANPTDVLIPVDRDLPVDGAAPGGDAQVPPRAWVEVPIPVAHLVVDSARRVLYGTVPGAAPVHGNSLVVIDADTGAIRTSLPLGSDPDNLALSDDGSTLWVGVDGEHVIRRVDLTVWPPAPGPKRPLPVGSAGAVLEGGEMVVLAGSKDAIAITLHDRRFSPTVSGLMVMDDGVPRSRFVPNYVSPENVIRGPGEVLFGAAGATSFSVLRVDTSGVTQTEFRELITDQRWVTLAHAEGFIVHSSGDVVDARDLTEPFWIGRIGHQGAVLALPGRRSIMISTSGTAPTVLRLLDLPGLRQLREQSFAGLEAGYVRDPVITGPDSVAFLVAPDRNGAAQRLVILRHALATSAPPPDAGAPDTPSKPDAQAGSGALSFSAPRLIPTPLQARLVTMADLDRDGRNDVLVGAVSPSDTQRGGVWIYRQGADGTLPNPTRYPIGRAPYDGPNQIGVVDLGPGQLPSVLVGLSGTDRRPGLMALYPQPAPATLGAPVLLDPGGGTSRGVAAGGATFAIGDFNQDGRPDAVTLDNDGRNLAVFLQTASGLPASPSLLVPYPEGEGGPRVIAADLDGDDLDDLILCAAESQGGGGVALFQKRSGGFTEALTLEHHILAVGDVTRDGRAEIVQLVRLDPLREDYQVVLLTRVQEAFEELGRLEWILGDGTWRIGDLDGDGVNDLVGVGDSARRLAVRRGTRDGLPGAAESFPFSERDFVGFRIDFAIGDVDGDGRADVAAATPDGLLVLSRQ